MALSPAAEQPGLEADHSHLNSIEDKSVYRLADTRYLYYVLRDSITLTLLNKYQTARTDHFRTGSFMTADALTSLHSSTLT